MGIKIGIGVLIRIEIKNELPYHKMKNEKD